MFGTGATPESMSATPTPFPEYARIPHVVGVDLPGDVVERSGVGVCGHTARHRATSSDREVVALRRTRPSGVMLRSRAFVGER